MWWNRSGLPRSDTRKYVLAPSAATAARRALRRSRGRPVRSAPTDSSVDPADAPPENRYAGIRQSQAGGLRMGLP